jgi:hypothetical protein
VYRAHSNQGYFTYDGIDVCGTRVANEVQREIEALNNYPDCKVTNISIAGYSLGGLISRYAIGMLHKRGVFDDVEPVSFTTFCSPHVGVVVLGNRFSAHGFNWVGQYSMSSTSRQLFLSDKFQNTDVPLLEYMSDPGSPFYRGLSRFSTRVLYANIINDHRCEYYTSAIYSRDPFSGRVDSFLGHYVEGYKPTIIDLTCSLRFDQTMRPPEPVPVWKRPLRYMWTTVRVLVIVPLWFVAFLANAAYQTVVSNTRQRTFKRTGQHVSQLFDDDDDGTTVDQMLENEADDVVESMYKALSQHEGETDGLNQLSVSDCQSTIIRNLNGLGWKKYPVHITLSTHSHAAVIVRYASDKFSEGKAIVDHWINSVLVGI